MHMKNILILITTLFLTISIFLFVKRFAAEKRKKELNDRFRFLETQVGRKYDDVLQHLGFNDQPIEINGEYPDFTFVAAFSDNHVGEGRHLVVNITKAFPGKKIVVYSMGLSPKNLIWFEKMCNVELRQANFSRYPEHVTDYFTYAFKPLIIAEALKEFGAVFWVDTSSSFRLDRPIQGLLERIRSTGKSSEDPDIFLLYELTHSTNSTTHPDMYRYLPPYKGEVPRKRGMFGASFQLVYRTQSTMDLVLKWLVLCALERNCIAPKDARLSCDAKIWKGEYGECHRFDQSAINLILDPFEKNFLSIETVDYFINYARLSVVDDDTNDCELQKNDIVSTPRQCFLCK